MRRVFAYCYFFSVAFVTIVGCGQSSHSPFTTQANADTLADTNSCPIATLAPPPADASAKPAVAAEEEATENAKEGAPSDGDEESEIEEEPDVPSDPDKSTMTGRVVFTGDPPAPRKIQVTKDPEICKATNTEIQEVVIGESGGLVNAVVEITGVKLADGEQWTWKTPEDGYVLRQKDCGFLPSMLVMPNGAMLKVFNDDPVAHNVNTGAWNEMQAKESPAIEKPIESRSPLRVSCNIHSWMEAWVYPVQSPLFAVTDKEGKFKIKNIPPGKYRVMVWHPNLGKQRERMEFAVGETVEHVFTYEAK